MAAMNARTKDLALLRALGAGPLRLSQVAFAEAGLIAVAAILLGCAVGATTLFIGASILDARTGLVLEPHIDPLLLSEIAGSAIMVALLVSAFPAFRAATTPIEEVLQS